MNKVKIHQFDPVIYSVKLWVAITSNGVPLSERFKDGNNGKDINTHVIDTHEAVTYYIQQKEKPMYWGVLIVFSEKKYCSIKTIAHEATHAAGFIWDHLGEEKKGDEADAYLVGWIADCIWKVKTNKI